MHSIYVLVLYYVKLFCTFHHSPNSLTRHTCGNKRVHLDPICSWFSIASGSFLDPRMCLASQAHHSQPRWNRHLNLARYKGDFFQRISLLVKISWHNKWHASAQTWVWRCLSELVQSSVVLGQLAIFEGVTLTPIQGISNIWGVVLSSSGNQGTVKLFSF